VRVLRVMANPSDIVTNFLLNAPPGEFHDVVTDVRSLLGDDSLLNEVAPFAYKEYNTEQMLVVDYDGAKALICKHGELSPSEYVDPANARVLSFDHFTQQVTSSRPVDHGELDADAEQWREALQRTVSAYAADVYDQGHAVVFSARGGAGAAFTLTVAISSALFNSGNYYNGRWRGVWSIAVQPGKTANVTGQLRVNVHYYEDGNVQLNTNTTKKKAVSAANPAKLAEEAGKAIRDLEQDFHQQLEISYDAMNETTFKALRRALPMTRQKIQWGKIAQYKLGNELQK